MGNSLNAAEPRKLPSKRHPFAARHGQLFFAYYVHQLDSGQDLRGCVNEFDTEHGSGETSDSAVILLHDVVEILDLAHFDVNFLIDDDLIVG